MTTTRIVRVREPGPPDHLLIEEQTLADPGPDQVRVAVRAAGVNFMDTQFRSGFYPQALPFSPGHEGAGRIEALGCEITGFDIGARVAWAQVAGSHGDYANVPVSRLVPLPESVSFEAAAAVLFQGMTAHYLACSTYPLKPGATCLVHSAAGGVGLLLCQIAKLRGALVIATVSAAEKRQAALAAGADHVLIYVADRDFSGEVKDCTAGHGVDVVFDAVGQATFEGSLRSLRARGLLAIYGESSGVVPPFDLRRLAQMNSLYVTRTGLGAYAADDEERPGACRTSSTGSRLVNLRLSSIPPCRSRSSRRRIACWKAARRSARSFSLRSRRACADRRGWPNPWSRSPVPEQPPEPPAPPLSRP